MNDIIQNEYFEWMYKLIGGDKRPRFASYRKLLMRLHDTEFTYIIPRDNDRANDGLTMRYRFSVDADRPEAMDYLNGPCSIFEMMVAMAIRCERNIMDNAHMGDRTGQWFWGMVTNLGLGEMIDSEFDRRYVDEVLTRFLNREYEPDGRGGLFTVRHCDRDLRKVEIWHQLCWYLDSIV